MDILKKLRIFNINTIKILAAVFMFIDHFGLMLYPRVMLFRILGRLSMPLFAFAIAEGCRYTRNKWKHFLMLFGLGAVCQIVYAIVDPKTQYFGILITFSFSVVMIYALQFAKKCTFEEKPIWWKATLAWLLFIALVAGTYLFCEKFTVDYKFYGCMLPVFASIFDFHRIPAPAILKKLDILPLRVLCMALPMVPMMYVGALGIKITCYSFLTIPLLLLYNGEKGKWNMKYFFYIFYPLHLALLEGVVYLSRML